MQATTETQNITFDYLASIWLAPEGAVRVWAENQHFTPEQAAEYSGDFHDSYIGEMSLNDFARDMVESEDRTDWLADYIDYQALEYDLKMDGMWESEGYLFRW